MQAKKMGKGIVACRQLSTVNQSPKNKKKILLQEGLQNEEKNSFQFHHWQIWLQV